jgi:hypothetical protein
MAQQLNPIASHFESDSRNKLSCSWAGRRSFLFSLHPHQDRHHIDKLFSEITYNVAPGFVVRRQYRNRGYGVFLGRHADVSFPSMVMNCDVWVC